MFAECFESILRACRREAAAWLLERGKTDLIESYQDNEREDRDLSDHLPLSVILLRHRYCVLIRAFGSAS